MKKVISLILLLTLILSLGASAFAAGSPKKDPPVTPVKATFDITEVEKVDADKKIIPVKYRIPAEAVIVTLVENADEALSKEDAAAFKAAYEEVKKIQDALVVNFFWVDVDADLAGDDFTGLDAQNALVYTFECEGENVRVLLNGKEVKVIDRGNGVYSAILPEAGAVAVLVDK